MRERRGNPVELAATVCRQGSNLGLERNVAVIGIAMPSVALRQQPTTILAQSGLVRSGDALASFPPLQPT